MWTACHPTPRHPTGGALFLPRGQKGLSFTSVTCLETNKEDSFWGAPYYTDITHGPRISWDLAGWPGTWRWAWRQEVIGETQVLVLSVSWEGPGYHHLLDPISAHSSVQLLSRVRLFATPWTAARQAFLSITNSGRLLKLMSIESVMPSNHLILCRPLLLLPPIFPIIRVIFKESALRIRWPK